MFTYFVSLRLNVELVEIPLGLQLLSSVQLLLVLHVLLQGNDLHGLVNQITYIGK